MSVLAAVLALPLLFWDKGPETSDRLRQAQIDHICVPPALASAWKTSPEISVEIKDPGHLAKVATPGVEFRNRMASATRAPWVNSNGWRFLRTPGGQFYYEAPGNASVLAAAEAFTFGVHAAIHTDDAGLEPFGKLLATLR